MLAYSNASPEPVPVVVTNLTVTQQYGADEVQWVVDTFELTDSVGDLGLVFFLSRPAVAMLQIQVFQDNVYQEYGSSYTIAATLDRVTLLSALESGSKLVVRYLAYESGETWSTQVFKVGQSTGALGLTFTLDAAPKDVAGTYHHVFLDGVLLVEGAGAGKYTITSGGVITLGTALAAGEQLVVTYAHD